MLEEWKKGLTLSMVPDGMCRAIADVIGVENLLELSALVGGNTFYVPKQGQILRPLRDQHIREEYSGYNTMELSIKYDVSERWVREVASRKNEEDKTK